MSQNTINQRLKFLIEHLSTSVRAFSEAIGESTSNTQNYIGARKVEPKTEYLAKVINHFSIVNAHWLLTGNGEPFLPDTTHTHENRHSHETNSKNFSHSQVVTGNKGATTTQQGGQVDNELALAKQENEHLRKQLQLTEALLTAKEETITLLRVSFNRPN